MSRMLAKICAISGFSEHRHTAANRADGRDISHSRGIPEKGKSPPVLEAARISHLTEYLRKIFYFQLDK